MKQFLTFAALAVALLIGAGPADAGRWRQQEVKWILTSQGGVDGQGRTVAATSINQRDTSFAALGATDDTTGSWSMVEADPFFQGDAVADTVTLGYLVLLNDSTVTASQTTTNMTVVFQGVPVGYSPSVVNGTTLATSICVATSGDRAFVFPLRLAQRGLSGANLDYLPIVAALDRYSVRAITTTVIGGG